jgi:hypothetical protein
MPEFPSFLVEGLWISECHPVSGGIEIELPDDYRLQRLVDGEWVTVMPLNDGRDDAEDR